jgi:hypothetical protein
MLPHFMRTIFDPNVGTVRWPGRWSTLRITCRHWWQWIASERTPFARMLARSIGLIRIMEAAAGNHQRIEHRDAVDTEENRLSQSRTLATRRAADDGRAFRTREDPGLYARFRWEYVRHDPHKPHRDVALRFAHEESSVPLHRHSSNTPSLDDSKIIHTRPCNPGVLLNTTSPGQSHRGAGASLLTAVRLPWRVDLLTRLIYVPLGDSS